MIAEPEQLRELRDEVLRKIGRNVLNLQKMEALLKYFVTIAKIEGNPNEIDKILAKNAKSVSRHTLGRLADTYIRTLHAKGEVPDAAPEDPSQIHISTTFRIECEEKTTADRKKALSTVAQERNNLIHKMLMKFDPNDFSSCQELAEKLDAQFELIKPQHQELIADYQTYQELIQEFSRHVQSDEFLSDDYAVEESET